MKMERKETINGKTVITTSDKVLFWHKIKEYEAQRKIAEGFWEWLELPNKTLIPDSISFQLDAWNRGS